MRHSRKRGQRASFELPRPEIRPGARRTVADRGVRPRRSVNAGKRLKPPIWGLGALACFVGILTCACTTPRLPDYPAEPSNLPVSVETETGLHIGLRPISSPDELTHYFGIDLLENGVLPIFVRLENHSDNATYLVRPDHFSLQARTQEIRPGTDYQARRLDSGDEITRAGVVSFNIPMIVAGNMRVSRASEVQRNLEMKQLRSRTVSPGRATFGFLYFSISKMGPPSANLGLTLRLEVEHTASGQKHAVHLPIEVAPR